MASNDETFGDSTPEDILLLESHDHDDVGVVIETKAKLDCDLTDGDESDVEEAMTMEETMTAEGTVDDRVDNMTRSILALELCGEVATDLGSGKRGFSRYKQALKGIRPMRFKDPAPKELPVTTAGFFSQMTFGWMSSMMWNIYRKGIKTIANLEVGHKETAKPNSDRLGRLWAEELSKKGPEKSSFMRTMLRFQSTRAIFTFFVLLISISLSFAGPAFVLYELLKYLKAGDIKISVGIGLVAAMVGTELGRTSFFALTWHYNYTTGVRVRTAVQSLIYRKILKLKNLGDKTVGELVNLLSNDGQRIFEAVAIGPLMLPGPIVLIMGLIYLLLLIGPWALIAVGTFAAFYPFMLYISKLTNYYRRKSIVITDRRVRMMNELLTCIKLIKMYAWEKSFTKAIAAIRSDERKVLESGAYVQSISTSTAPIVPVMASVFLFVGFVLTGNELTPVLAFTIVAVLNSMRFSLGVLPFAVKAISDARVSFERCKSILLMDEMEPHPWAVFNDKYAVVVNKATFRWDKEVTDKPEVKDKGNKKDKFKANGKNGAMADVELQKLNATELTNGGVPFVDTPALQDITFMAEKGKLFGICGGVGSGKSSLLSAILGRMVHVSGKIALEGSIAYVSQQAWITNTTVRENILFGEEYDAIRYAAVAESCSLIDDFSDFVDGDQTEIGERGINLSGGQKQRISLARAVYSNKDIYLLDDPLSAVDIHIGRHIFSECIMKQLQGKTVLFVTHQLQYLNQCHSVMVIKDGVVTDLGTHSQLMAKDTEYANLIKVYYTKEKENEASQESIGGHPKSLHRQFSADPGYLIRQRTLSQGSRTRTMSQGSRQSDDGSGSPRSKRDPLRQMSMMSNRTMSVEEETSQQKGGKLIVAEEKAEGKVGWPVYKSYMKAAGGLVVSCFVIFTFIVAILAQSFTTWWLSYWLNQGSGNTTIIVNNVTVISQSISDHPDLYFYTAVYGGSVGVIIITTAFRAFVFMKATLRASSTMHNNIFSKMMTSSMQFFDTTPVGRIINRFSVDLDEIDIRLPSSSEMFLQNVLLILNAIAMIVYVSPWFLFALIPLIICFGVLNVIFTSGVRELKRMVAITQSPVISHVTASIQGISTIHAYGKTDEFIKRFDALVNKNSTYFYLFCCANRWLALRLDLISISMVGVTGVCIVLTYDSITPTLAGLAMSFAIQMTGLFQFTIRQAIESEAKFVAVQRLQQYSKNVMSEAPAIIKDNRPPADWPKEGEIKFEKYKLRYRDNLPLALKGIGFTIKQKEKIGIVGRSGSGKSSLGVALFRLVEPAAGTIYIDGIDITKIGLEDLRSHLAIIPQDPVLFVGPVRYNLDPFGHHKDNELWEALEKCHVKDTISSLELKLDHMVVENGENFSVGERQLLCMARALLRNSKILMLDEATAAIDTETDALVQTTIKETFSDCTMLIIAHRLNTVLGCSRILVMEEGKVVEYGQPKTLMASSKSKFKAMMDAMDEQHKNI